MAEFEEDRGDAAIDEAEMRPCAFCGATIHPSSHRCPECGGHVGIAWGTVHREQFLFLLAAIFMGVGAMVSWDQARPSALTGLQTIRGSLIFTLAVYGVIVGLIGIFNRRTVVWPYFMNALVALWVGIQGITNALDSEFFKTLSEERGVTWWHEYRAIPPGMWLLTVGGGLVVMAVLKGLVGGFAGAKAKAREAADERATKDAGRRGRRAGAVGGASATGVATPPPPPSDLPPPPPPVV
jgi:hypothetical protein